MDTGTQRAIAEIDRQIKYVNEILTRRYAEIVTTHLTAVRDRLTHQ